MYTQISLKQILNTLSKCDQKQVNEGNFDNIYVTLEDIIGTLREDEKTDFVKENAKKLYDIIDCYTNIVDNDFDIKLRAKDISEVLCEYNDNDIADYLESCGYVVGTAR